MMLRIITQAMLMVVMLPTLVFAQVSDSFIISTQIGTDAIPPTIPANVIATAIAQTQIDVSWNASTDNFGVTGYEVWRDGSFTATVTSPSLTYNDTGLSPATSYAYEVRAYDLAGNYSGFGTSTSAVTLAVPTIPPTGGGNPSVLSSNSLTITAQAYENRIDLALGALVPITATIKWGKSSDMEGGTLALTTYRKSHETSITGLTPRTTYKILVIARDAYGRVVERTIVVRTTGTLDDEAPSNPTGFTAAAESTGIRLTWQNPGDEDFDEVRIMRLEGNIPVDPYDGNLIYEGPREEFFDTDVKEGKAYGYTIFARDRGGNFSSGAVTFVRAYEKEAVGDARLVIAPNQGTTTQSNFADSIVISQNGETVENERGRFSLSNDAPFDITIRADIFPRVLKTIIVTLVHPTDEKKIFSFLLRSNESRTAYTARIGKLEDAGAYRATMTVLNLKSQSVASDEFVLEVSGQEKKDETTGTQLNARIILPLILLLLALIALRYMYVLGKKRKKESQSERERDGF